MSLLKWEQRIAYRPRVLDGFLVIRPVRLLLGLMLLALAYGLIAGSDPMSDQAWFPLVGYVWLALLLLSVVGGVWLTIHGIGLLTTELLSEDLPEERRLTAAGFFSVYLGGLAFGVAGGALLARYTNIPAEFGVMAAMGLLFLMAGVERPWWLFATIRRLGWLAGIRSDRAMRWLLRVIGVLLFVPLFAARQAIR